MSWTEQMIIVLAPFESSDVERYIRAMKYLARRQERIGQSPDRDTMYWAGYEWAYEREKAVFESIFGLAQ